MRYAVLTAECAVLNAAQEVTRCPEPEPEIQAFFLHIMILNLKIAIFKSASVPLPGLISSPLPTQSAQSYDIILVN